MVAFSWSALSGRGAGAACDRPLLDVVLALKVGTGLVEVSSDRFTAIGSCGSDPCGFRLDATPTFVPEPTCAFLIGMGLAMLGRRSGKS